VRRSAREVVIDIVVDNRTAAVDDNDVQVAGFTRTDTVALNVTDSANVNPTTFGAFLGYGQDNWSLDYWYGQTDFDLTTADREEKLHSLAGQVSIGKTTLRALWERSTLERTGLSDVDLDYTTLGIQYDLGSRARIFGEYSRDDGFKTPSAGGILTETDTILVGYRVDF